MGSRAIWSLVFLGGAWEARKVVSPFSPRSRASPPPFFPKLFLAPAAEMPVGLQEPSGSSSRKKNKNKTSPCVSQSSLPHGLWGPLQPAVTERPLTPLCQRRLDWREQVSSSPGPCSCALGQNKEHCGRYAPVPTPLRSRSSCFFAVTSVVLGVRTYL